MNSLNCVQKYKMVPPDGGYGYVIVLAVVIINVAIFTFGQSYGILFQSFYEELDMNTTSIVTQYSLNIVSFSLSGYATGSLMEVLSRRQITFLGSIIMVTGGLCTVFASSSVLLTLSQVVQSLGTGFLINTSYTAINDYFVTKRWLFLTLTQLVPAITSMLSPFFLNWCLNYYGQRSTLLILVGFIMQTLVAACLLQPVSWHMKRVLVENVPEKEALISTSLDTKNSIKLNESIQSEIVTLNITIADTAELTHSVNNNTKLNHEITEESSKKINLRKMLEQIVDMTILRDFILMNACLGISICMFAHSIYILLLPIALAVEDKWDKKTIAWAIALLSFGDIATKITMVVFSKFLAKVPTRVVYFIGIIIAVVTRLGHLWFINKTVIMCFMTLAGVSQCIIVTMIPHIISEMTDQKRFPIAFGIVMIMLGLISVVFGPAVGKIRDLSNSYLTVFYILTSFFAIVALFWCIEMCYVNNQRKIMERQKNKLRRVNTRR